MKIGIIPDNNFINLWNIFRLVNVITKVYVIEIYLLVTLRVLKLLQTFCMNPSVHMINAAEHDMYYI